MSMNGGIIGVSDHGGWAVLVTVARDGTLLDRRRVELVGEGLPKLPHHSEGQGLPLDEAVELVERVRLSAERHAVLALDAVTMAVPRILGVALRKCPQLPPIIAERTPRLKNCPPMRTESRMALPLWKLKNVGSCA